MGKQQKSRHPHGQRSPYKIITQSAYEGRFAFKAASVVLAALSLSAVFAAMPPAVYNMNTVSLEGAAAPAVVEEQSADPTVFYTDETLVSLSVPQLEEEAAITADVYAEKSSLIKTAGDFSAYVSAVDNEEAGQKLEEIRLEKERAEKERQARIALQKAQQAAAQSGSYVRLNASGVPMSEKSGYVELDENGVPVNYAYCITGNSTAYYSGYITSTGTRPMQGTVAVNPNQIPYGTRMWITSADGRYVYGLAVAEDTGGFIYFRNGATVDLYMHSEADCINWGWRAVNIYILN
ncbi:MAG: 3D domain-containing protein [Clostridia bacterium]|nr:3D domain-containing protein [Clostridia bacterium]